MSSPGAQNTTELEAILRALRESNQPLTSAALGKMLKRKGAALKPVLDAQARAGTIYSWAANLYWHKDPAALARERLLNLTATEVLPAGVIDKRVAAEGAKIKAAVIKQARTELVRQGVLREIPKSKLIVNMQYPERYLETAIAGLLADFGREQSAERIRDFLAPSQTPSEAIRAPDVDHVADQMFAAMNRIAFAPGTTVTFYRLRQQPELAHVPKSIFDQAALLLRHEGRALLAEHGHAGRLPKSEQDELVTDGLGTYYVSIYSV